MRTPANLFFAAVAALALQACQSTSNAPVDLGVGTENVTTTQSGTLPPASTPGTVAIAATEPGSISDVELRVPRVELREGTSFYRTYDKGAEEDPAAVIYQAALSETTRACSFGGGMMTINVAAAGRVAPGPKGRAGTITMPIRVAVSQGGEVLYSKLHQQQVQIGETGATQFVFNDPAVTIPQPTARNLTVFVGYDEGPYDTP
jgi:hypothetical protein